MGYYVAPKSYLKPKQRFNVKQRILVITFSGIALVAGTIVFFTMQFGNPKNATAKNKTESNDEQILLPVTLTNTNMATNEGDQKIDYDFPVELAYFKADLNPHNVELKWSTMYEYKNEYFTLEKSINGCKFDEIGCIDSQKSKNLSSDYSFIDDSVSDGIAFYRLRQTSEDGKQTFIALEKVTKKKEDNTQSLYIEKVGPQPFDKYFNVNYYTDREGGVAVELYNKEGRKIYKCYTSANQGYNTCRFIDGEKLTDDEYTLRITNSSGAYVQRIRRKV